MTKKITKTILSVLLAAAIVLSLVPGMKLSVYADGEELLNVTTGVAYPLFWLANSGNANFGGKAYSAVGDRETLQLLKNISTNTPLALSSKHIVFDLNGYVLSSSSNAFAINVNTNSSVTLIDSRPDVPHAYVVQEDGHWNWDDSELGNADAKDYETLTGAVSAGDVIIIKGGAITSSSTGGAFFVGQNANLTIEQGNIVGCIKGGICANKGCVVIKNGNICGNGPADSSNSGGIAAESASTLLVFGGTVRYNCHNNVPGMINNAGTGGISINQSASFYIDETNTVVSDNMTAATIYDEGNATPDWAEKICNYDGDFSYRKNAVQLSGYHTITYKKGGEDIFVAGAPSVFTENDGIDAETFGAIVPPLRENETFDGWYAGSASDVLVTSIAAGTAADVTVYANIYSSNTDGDITFTMFDTAGYADVSGGRKYVAGFGAMLENAADKEIARYGFFIYNADSDENVKANLYNGTVDDLEENGYRFYSYVTSDEPQMFYAKAYVLIGETYYYSNLVGTIGNDSHKLILERD